MLRRRSLSDILVKTCDCVEDHNYASDAFGVQKNLLYLTLNSEKKLLDVIVHEFDKSPAIPTSAYAFEKSPAISTKSLMLAASSPQLTLNTINPCAIPPFIPKSIADSSLIKSKVRSSQAVILRSVKKARFEKGFLEDIEPVESSNFVEVTNGLEVAKGYTTFPMLRMETTEENLLEDYYLLNTEEDWSVLYTFGNVNTVPSNGVSNGPVYSLVYCPTLERPLDNFPIQLTNLEDYYLLTGVLDDFSVLASAARSIVEPAWLGYEEGTAVDYYITCMNLPVLMPSYLKMPPIVPITLTSELQQSLTSYVNNLQIMSLVGSLDDQFLALRQLRYFIILLNQRLQKIDIESNNLEKKTAYLERKFHLFLSFGKMKISYTASLEQKIGGILICLFVKSLLNVNKKTLPLFYHFFGSTLDLLRSVALDNEAFGRSLKRTLDKCRQLCILNIQLCHCPSCDQSDCKSDETKDCKIFGYYLSHFSIMEESLGAPLQASSSLAPLSVLNLIEFKQLLLSIRRKPDLIETILTDIDERLVTNKIYLKLTKNHIVNNYLTSDYYCSKIPSLHYFNQSTLYPLLRAHLKTRGDVLRFGALFKNALEQSFSALEVSKKFRHSITASYETLLLALKNSMNHFNEKIWQKNSFYKKISVKFLYALGAIKCNLEDFIIEKAYLAIDAGHGADLVLSEALSEDLKRTKLSTFLKSVKTTFSPKKSPNKSPPCKSISALCSHITRTKFRLIFGFDDRIEPVFVSEPFKLDTILFGIFQDSLLGTSSVIDLGNWLTVNPQMVLDIFMATK